MAAKLHLALNALPEFSRLPAALAGDRLVVAPDLVYLEHAFDAAKYGQNSPRPALEINIPTVHDRTLAPAGKHVLSAVVQYAPYEETASTDAARAQLLENTIKLLEEYAPGIRNQVVGSQLLLPADLEREFRLTGGHWHHGELALDQFLMADACGQSLLRKERPSSSRCRSNRAAAERSRLTSLVPIWLGSSSWSMDRRPGSAAQREQ